MTKNANFWSAIVNQIYDTTTIQKVKNMDTQATTMDMKRIQGAIGQANRVVLRTLFGLVEKNQLDARQLPLVFYTATKSAGALKDEIEPLEKRIRQMQKEEEAGAMGRDEAEERQKLAREYAVIEKKRKETHMLASLSACKLSGMHTDFPAQIFEDTVSALRNPDDVSLDELKLHTRSAMVLIGREIIRNGSLIGLAEAVADGLSKTADGEKAGEMKKLGSAVLGRLSNEVERTYMCVFELAQKPSSSKDNPFNVILRAHLNRAERGESVFGEQVIQRIRKTLNAPLGCLSDGDMGLPKPRAMGTKPTQRTGMLRKPAFAGN